jgi:hypothetical protein
MANLPRAGRRVAALVGAWTLAVLSLAAETAAQEIERPTFILDVPEQWVENAGLATDWAAVVTRQGDANAECFIDVRMENLPPTEAEQAEWVQFLASEDGPVIIAQFQVGSGETVLETRRRRIDGSELVVVVSEKEGDRITAAYFFSLLLPLRVHIIRCTTAAANYAALQAEVAAIIEALEVKP